MEKGKGTNYTANGHKLTFLATEFTEDTEPFFSAFSVNSVAKREIRLTRKNVRL